MVWDPRCVLHTFRFVVYIYACSLCRMRRILADRKRDCKTRRIVKDEKTMPDAVWRTCTCGVNDRIFGWSEFLANRKEVIVYFTWWPLTYVLFQSDSFSGLATVNNAYLFILLSFRRPAIHHYFKQLVSFCSDPRYPVTTLPSIWHILTQLIPFWIFWCFIRHDSPTFFLVGEHRVCAGTWYLGTS